MKAEGGMRRGGAMKKGVSKGHQWLLAHKDYAGDDCLIWPYSLSRRDGLGNFQVDGKLQYAHRFMCELVNGPAPSPRHVATFTCDGGTKGCCHPKHLKWRTRSESKKAYYADHQYPSRHGCRAKISTAQIKTIIELSAKHGVTQIARITGLPRKNVEYWTHTRIVKGHHVGPITVKRLAGLPTWREQRRQQASPAPAWNAVMAQINALVPRGVAGRDDICQDIALAIMEGRTSIEIVRAGGIRPFMSVFNRDNFEQRGFSLSLDLPMRDGRSWHDVLEAAA